MNKKTKIIILIGACALVLLLGLQSPRVSNGLTIAFVDLLKRFLGGFPGGGTSEVSIYGYLRKIAHFGVYLTLTTIVYMTLSHYIKGKIHLLIATLVIVGFISFVDEAFVQRVFSGGRTSSIYDIFYDMLGCLTSLLNIMIGEFYRRYSDITR